jgi:hypothetical protein
MIRYALGCDQGHEFEGWFRDSAGFGEQVADGLVICPVCGSEKVNKLIMAPGVARTDRGASAATAATPVPAEEGSASPMALMSDKARELRGMIRALREHVAQNAENVGPRFAEEARKIHEGDAQARSIYGEATKEEARKLMEDGIPALPLPVLPDDRN